MRTKYKPGDKVGNLTILKVERRNNMTYYFVRTEDGKEIWRSARHLKYAPENSGQFKQKDITGQKFGRLTALYPIGKKGHIYLWRCLCECGNLTDVAIDCLSKGSTHSCGCIRSETSKEKGHKYMKQFVESDVVDGTSISKISRKKPIKSNTSGVTGVYYDKSRDMWCARIVFKGKCYRLGRFTKKEDAIAAREKAEEELFGKFLSDLTKRKTKEKK